MRPTSPAPMSDLTGKRVLVTGASGGIGAACARAFNAERCDVVVHYHRGRERADSVAAELGGVRTIAADLTMEADVDRLFTEAGALDVCAAVAGVWPSGDVPVWELPLERREATLRANLTATFLTARASRLARVNAVAPGWTVSPMTRGHLEPELVARITRTMPLRKVAEPEDVARQVVVLASDELSGHVTGQVVTVAGGMEGRVLHQE
jgi:3-oxoacyl-[acyl-carrier protein] reductase